VEQTAQAECDVRTTGVEQTDVQTTSAAMSAGPTPSPTQQSAGISQAGDCDAVPNENNDSRQDDANGLDQDQGGGDREGEGDAVAAEIERLWQRPDGGKWTAELKRAHTAFERGKGWGIEWAACVDRFYNFEAAWGYSDSGSQITVQGRPSAIEWWLGRGRKWEKPVKIGVLGDSKTPHTFVADWWTWWVNVAPSTRSDLSGVLKLHGKNGMLQIMATLLWWGEQVADGNPAEQGE
jgi:hypothetical protein